MLTKAQVQRYAFDSGLRDMMIAEKEVVLTFLLQLLSERGLLARLAFKGGTCLRKMFVGSQGRFSGQWSLLGLDQPAVYTRTGVVGPRILVQGAGFASVPGPRFPVHDSRFGLCALNRVGYRVPTPFVTNFCTLQLRSSATQISFSEGHAMAWIQANSPRFFPGRP